MRREERVREIRREVMSRSIGETCERIANLEELAFGLLHCGDDDADARDCPMYDASEPYRCRKERLLGELGIGNVS